MGKGGGKSSRGKVDEKKCRLCTLTSLAQRIQNATSKRIEVAPKRQHAVMLFPRRETSSCELAYNAIIETATL